MDPNTCRLVTIFRRSRSSRVTVKWIQSPFRLLQITWKNTKTIKRQHGIHSSTEFQDLKTKKNKLGKQNGTNFFVYSQKKNLNGFKNRPSEQQSVFTDAFSGRSLEKKGLMVHFSEKSCFYINEKSMRGLTSYKCLDFYFTLYKVYL